MPGLLDSLLGMVGPQILNSLASRLGENESAVKSGMQSGVAAILGSIVSKSGDSNLMGQIFSMITGSASQGILGNLSSLASSGPSGAVADIGQKFLGMLMGNKQTEAVSAVAKASGLSSSSATSLMAMAAPLVMGFLSKKVKDDGLNVASLSSLLTAEMPSIRNMMPAGLGSIVTGLGSAMAAGASAGSSAMSSTVSAGSSAMRGATAVAEEAGSSASKWLVPALLAAAALAGLFWFMNKGGVEDVTKGVTDATKGVAAVTKDVAATATDAAKGALAALGEFFKRKLPDGVELNIPRLGVENQLIGFVEDATKPIDKTTWFNFDRLLFDTGAATLQASSQEQLTNVAAIMKAYPKLAIKLGGYTDNVGDKAANQTLSANRANNVMAELVKLGVSAKRLSAEGYGEEHPIAANDSDEGRQKNRRIAMRVTGK